MTKTRFAFDDRFRVERMVTVAVGQSLKFNKIFEIPVFFLLLSDYHRQRETWLLKQTIK